MRRLEDDYCEKGSTRWNELFESDEFYAENPHGWQEQPGNEFDDFNDDSDMWVTECCGTDYDCAC